MKLSHKSSLLLIAFAGLLTLPSANVFGQTSSGSSPGSSGQSHYGMDASLLHDIDKLAGLMDHALKHGHRHDRELDRASTISSRHWITKCARHHHHHHDNAFHKGMQSASGTSASSPSSTTTPVSTSKSGGSGSATSGQGKSPSNGSTTSAAKTQATPVSTGSTNQATGAATASPKQARLSPTANSKSPATAAHNGIHSGTPQLNKHLAQVGSKVGQHQNNGKGLTAKHK